MQAKKAAEAVKLSVPPEADAIGGFNVTGGDEIANWQVAKDSSGQVADSYRLQSPVMF